MPAAEHKPDFEFKANTPYPDLTGELWGVFCEYLIEIRYKGITLYHAAIQIFIWNMRLFVLLGGISDWTDGTKH